jgi:hypothetical protein
MKVSLRMLLIAPNDELATRYAKALTTGDVTVECHRLTRLGGYPRHQDVAQLLSPVVNVPATAHYAVANIVVVASYAIDGDSNGTNMSLTWLKEITIPTWRVMIAVTERGLTKKSDKFLGLVQSMERRIGQDNIILCVDYNEKAHPGPALAVRSIIDQVKLGTAP